MSKSNDTRGGGVNRPLAAMKPIGDVLQRYLAARRANLADGEDRLEAQASKPTHAEIKARIGTRIRYNRLWSTGTAGEQLTLDREPQ